MKPPRFAADDAPARTKNKTRQPSAARLKLSNLSLLSTALLLCLGAAPPLRAAEARPNAYFLMAAGLQAAGDPRITASAGRETRTLAGWTVHVSRELLAQEPKDTARALELLEKQLQEIVREVPPAAVAALQKVPLYFSPEYPGVKPRAEFHPDAGWLRNHGRDPAMAKGIEFTNIRIFEREMNRMPNFALHELAHAYHHLVLPQGFRNPQIKAAYEKAKASGKYDRVERWHGNGKPNTFERAYAMTNPQEYFAETTEAFFSRNDYYPFTCDQLKQHDPEMFALLQGLWGIVRQTAPESPLKPTGDTP